MDGPLARAPGPVSTIPAGASTCHPSRLQRRLMPAQGCRLGPLIRPSRSPHTKRSSRASRGSLPTLASGLHVLRGAPQACEGAAKMVSAASVAVSPRVTLSCSAPSACLGLGPRAQPHTGPGRAGLGRAGLGGPALGQGYRQGPVPVTQARLAHLPSAAASTEGCPLTAKVCCSGGDHWHCCQPWDQGGGHLSQGGPPPCSPQRSAQAAGEGCWLGGEQS